MKKHKHIFESDGGGCIICRKTVVELFDEKNLKTTNTLFENCKKAVRKEIRKDCWKEAYKILELCDEKERIDFLKYHQEDKGNICCLVLDFAKSKLVDEGKMEQKPDDCFKNPYIWLKDETI